jgi:seryl-tRNA synthetase
MGRDAVGDQLDAAASLDTRLRDLAAERDGLRRRVNELSRDVGQLRAAGEVDKAEAMMAESRTLGDRERELARPWLRLRPAQKISSASEGRPHWVGLSG